MIPKWHAKLIVTEKSVSLKHMECTWKKNIAKVLRFNFSEVGWGHPEQRLTCTHVSSRWLALTKFFFSVLLHSGWMIKQTNHFIRINKWRWLDLEIFLQRWSRFKPHQMESWKKIIQQQWKMKLIHFLNARWPVISSIPKRILLPPLFFFLLVIRFHIFTIVWKQK